MKIITPERLFRVIELGIVSTTQTALTSPVGVGQVVIINGVDILIAAAEIPAADIVATGTTGFALTTDVDVTDILALGSADAQDAQEGDNLLICEMDYQMTGIFTTSGGAIAAVVERASWSWRGLPFEGRPLSNVDMRFLVDAISVTMTISGTLIVYYQIAQLEPGDIGISDELPVGARVVRGPQIPADGVAGPAGRIS